MPLIVRDVTDPGYCRVILNEHGRATADLAAAADRRRSMDVALT
jgi:hypothetical protein